MAKRKAKQGPEVVRRDGGLCVTFANSASAKRKSFRSYADLLAWGQRLEALTGADVERVERLAAERPADAEAVVRRALELRASAGRTLRAVMRRKTPPAADLATVRGELESMRSAERWVWDGDSCRWVFGDRGGEDLDRMLWPVVKSMEELLAGKYRLKIGECAGEDCDLLFVDRGPGSPRRWCHKNACGSKASTRRHYRRRIKPRQERSWEATKDYWRRLGKARELEEREREAEEPPPRPRRPGPRVA